MASGSAPAAGRTVRPERSELFGRLEAFLPAMAAANDALAREDPKSHDIEELTDPTGEHIEMNLACGVLEGKPAEEPAEPIEPIDTAELVSKLADGSADGPACLDQLQMPARQEAEGLPLESPPEEETAPPDVDGGDNARQADAPEGPPKTRKQRRR